MLHQKLVAPFVSAILLTGSVAFAQAGPGGPPPAAGMPVDIAKDPAKDPVLLALKEALAPNAEQLKSLEERVGKWRADQRKVLEDYCRYGVMPKPDGTGVQRITDFSSMSWAP